MNANNALLLTQIGLQLTTQLQQVMTIQAQAHAEGREPSDEEVTQAASAATAAIEALKATKD